MIVELLTVAAMLTGRPGTQISTDLSMCPRFAGRGSIGCADIPGNVIHLEAGQVGLLERLAASQRVQPYLGALALLAFCHEARHVRGTIDERVAERWAVWHAPIVARLLGASYDWTQAMRRWIPYWHRETT